MLIIDRMSDKNDRESYNLYFVVMECEEGDGELYNFDIPCMKKCMVNPILLGKDEVFFKTKRDAKETIKRIHDKIMNSLVGN